MDVVLKSVAQTISKKKQTGMIVDHVYGKYDVFKRFKPLAVDIDQDLVAVLSQYDPALIVHVLVNHCHRLHYLKALTRSGKRFDLNNRFEGEINAEEQATAQRYPAVQQALTAQAEHQAAKATTEAEVVPTQTEETNDVAE